MLKIKNQLLGFLCIVVILLSACKKDGGYNTPSGPTVVKKWTIALSAKNENPAPASRNETGTASLELLSENSLKYSITVNGLTSGDALVASHLHVGNVISNGPIVLDLKPSFTGNASSGSVTNLRTTFVDSLKSDVNEIYINIHSSQVASGLVRGQLNTNIEMVADVILNGNNEVPAITTTATGIALIRVTSSKQLCTRVTVNNVEAGDALVFAHIHRGAAGANGAVMTGICATAVDFGIVKVFTVDDAIFASLKNDALYVNAHSTNKPAGIVRGQIR